MFTPDMTMEQIEAEMKTLSNETLVDWFIISQTLFFTTESSPQIDAMKARVANAASISAEELEKQWDEILTTSMGKIYSEFRNRGFSKDEIAEIIVSKLEG